MQNSKPELSIIIVNYRSEQYLEKCLASLFNDVEVGKYAEIIMVNNDQRTTLESTNNIKVINTHKNIGFGAANNVGAKIAQGEYILFLNPDTEIEKGAITALFNKIKSTTKYAVIGPRLVDQDGKTQAWCAGKKITLWQIIKNNFGIIESRKIWESRQETPADWVSGAALCIKKEVFDKVGGFNQKFFMYFEDVDLCRKVKKSGLEVAYCPDISIWHKGGKSYGSKTKQKLQYFKSLIYFLIK